MELERLVGLLRAIAPNQADARTIAACERAMALLGAFGGSPLRTELELMLGSHLLESPDGDPSANKRRARELYSEVRARSSRERSPDAWRAATNGLANALFMDPAAGRTEFDEALSLFGELQADARSRADWRTLGSALLNGVTALTRAPAGDRGQRLEQALGYAREAVDVLSRGRGTATWDPRPWGRAQYALGSVYWQRQRGLRAQNVHLAVTAFREALAVRTADTDVVGRARTLRALALAYPEWTGADSRAHGQWLADEAAAAAEQIARHDPRVAGRLVGWARYAGEASALNADLDWVDGMHPDVPNEWLQAAIANHREALAATPREQMPFRWAEWMGGLGRLLGLLARVRPECLAEAVACFDHATSTDGLAGQPRLRGDLCARLGSLGHEFARWEVALRGSAGALEASDESFAAAGGAESRELELETSNRLAFIAAHAAARLGRLEDAVRHAEHGRSRTLIDAAAAEEASLASVSAEQRAEVTEARARVRRLERELAALDATGDTAEAARAGRRLADHLGVNPDLLQLRVTRRTTDGDDERSAEYSRIATELHAAREAMRHAVSRARGASAPFGATFGWPEVRAVAARAGYPIVYVVPSTYGSVALIVPPDGAPDALFLDGITSDDTRRLVHGTAGQPGVLAAVVGDERAIAGAIPSCLEALRRAVIAPLSDWLGTHGFRRAALSPLGSFALLPLHAAASRADDPVFGYVPSARVWSLALARLDALATTPLRYFGVANPTATGAESLPFAVAEVRSACQRLGASASAATVRRDAARRAVEEGVRAASVIHFACHGEFRPADPRESVLLLAGDDRLTLGEFMSGTIPLSGARVVLLSACQTAASESRRLINESFGFPAALLLSGAAGVVATLWPVVDSTTALFMDRFHELHAAGWDAASATAAAQRWLAMVTAGDARTRASAMRAALVPGDEEAEVALRALEDELAAMDPASTPYQEPDFWAAFAYAGA